MPYTIDSFSDPDDIYDDTYPDEECWSGEEMSVDEDRLATEFGDSKDVDAVDNNDDRPDVEVEINAADLDPKGVYEEYDSLPKMEPIFPHDGAYKGNDRQLDYNGHSWKLRSRRPRQYKPGKIAFAHPTGKYDFPIRVWVEAIRRGCCPTTAKWVLQMQTLKLTAGVLDPRTLAWLEEKAAKRARLKRDKELEMQCVLAEKATAAELREAIAEARVLDRWLQEQDALTDEVGGGLIPRGHRKAGLVRQRLGRIRVPFAYPSKKACGF